MNNELENTLRTEPEKIILGEIRDIETISQLF